MLVRVKKIIQEGRALAYQKDGSHSLDEPVYLVWGALPGEILEVEKIKTKEKGKIIFAKINNILSKNNQRVEPKEEHYLSCSPFSITKIEYENYLKKELLSELFQSAKPFGSGNLRIEFYSNLENFGYRNKIEYNFWQLDVKDPSTLEYCFFQRESKQRILIKSCALADPEINIVAKRLLNHFKKNSYTSYNLKSLILRKSEEGVSASLFIKDKIEIITPILDGNLINFEIHFSDHRAPVSRSDEVLLKLGLERFSINLLEKKIYYSSQSFVQINLVIFQQVLLDIKQFIYSKVNSNYTIYDLYCGVGSIGLSLLQDINQRIIFVDNLESNINDLKYNINNLNVKNAEIIYLSDQNLTLNFVKDSIVIVDPPRAGLSLNLVNKLLLDSPEFIIYLSCNPITQKRDIDLFLAKQKYQIKLIKGYNFFPGTPHIENLIILQKTVIRSISHE